VVPDDPDPLVPPLPVVPDVGAADAVGAGEAAIVEIGPRIAAPATPPTMSAPAIFAFWLAAARRTGLCGAAGAASAISAGSCPQSSLMSFTKVLLEDPGRTGAGR
jgi:hypothetical protein